MPKLSTAERAERDKQAALAKRRAARADCKARKAAQLPAPSPEIGAKNLGVQGVRTMGHIKQARMNLVEAFELIGGVPNLVKWGKANLTEFYRLWARLVPKEAAEEQNNSLETLLAMLAARPDTPVGVAAMEIGAEKMREGRAAADAEDAALALQAIQHGTVQ